MTNHNIKGIQLDPSLPISDEFNEKIMSHLESLGLTENQNGSYPLTTKDLQIYTLYHKQAFLALVMEFDRDPSWTYWLHDSDKLVLYGLMDWKYANGLHKDFSNHHYGSLTPLRVEQAVFDYECARFTKSDKPMNAYEWVNKHMIMPLETRQQFDHYLRTFQMNSLCPNEYGFWRWKEKIKDPKYISKLIEFNCNNISGLLHLIKSNGIYAGLKKFNSIY